MKIKVRGKRPAVLDASPYKVPSDLWSISRTDSQNWHPQASVIIITIFSPLDGGGHSGHALNKLCHTTIGLQTEADRQQQECYCQKHFPEEVHFNTSLESTPFNKEFLKKKSHQGVSHFYSLTNNVSKEDRTHWT